jgi:hypothetical protein
MAHPAREFSYQLASFCGLTRDDQDDVVVDAVNVLYDFADHLADSPMHQRMVRIGQCRTCNRLGAAASVAARIPG